LGERSPVGLWHGTIFQVGAATNVALAQLE
jgi:hypothetical protein